MKSYLYEFLIFGLKEAKAAIFAGLFFVLLFISNYIPLFGVPRYDFLFIAAILIQVVLYLTKFETKEEIKVICMFHIIGLVLELYKTHPAIGSWSYPEEAFFKLGTVPLYSGFMYAAVGSYISQAWKLLKMHVPNYPNYVWSIIVSLLIYINFFTNHYIYDVRLFLIAIVIITFWKTHIFFTPLQKERSMPLVLGFGLVAFFIWIAENISTYLGAWKYPDQIHVWTVVSMNKITSWFLLVIISFILVAYIHKDKKYSTHEK